MKLLSQWRRIPRRTVVLVGILASGPALGDVPHWFTYQGRITDANGAAIQDSAVVLRLRILNSAGDCILYSEQQTINTSGSAGLFSVEVGSDTGAGPGSGKRLGSEDVGNSMAQVLNNSGSAISGRQLVSTSTSCSYTPSPGDDRKLQVVIISTFGLGTINLPLAPLQRLATVPYATVAQTLDGYAANQFLRLTGSAAAPTANVTAGNVNTLMDLLFASSGANMSKFTEILGNYTAASGFSFTTQSLNMGGNRITNVAAPTSASDATPRSYVDSHVAGQGVSGLGSLGAGDSGRVLTWNGTAWTAATVSSLPSQTGNSGRFLTTNGTTASWSTVNQLPPQTGNSGRFLTTDGTTASWATVSGSGTVTGVAATSPLAIAGTATVSPTVEFSPGTAGNTGYLLTSVNGGQPGFAQLNLATSPALTGVLPIANGGTGSATGSISGTTALTFAAGGTNQNVTLTPSGTGDTVLGGQVVIGGTTPATSALLDIQSTTSGLLIPRMTTAERDAISSPATGLQIYNTTTNQLNFYNASSWQALGVAGSGISSLTAGTGLTGGTITSSGTIAVNVGTGASQIVQLDGSARLPAVDGSLLTGLTASQISSGTLPINRGGTNSATALNNNRIMVSSGGAIVEAGALTNGQLLVGSTGAAPVAAALTAGTGISITNGAGSITVASTVTPYTDSNARSAISATAPVAYDSATGVISLGTVGVANGGTGATTLGANQLILGNGTSALSSLASGTSGQILRSGGSAAPSWSTATYPNTVSANALLYASSADTVAGLSTANSSVLVTNGSGVPSWASIATDTFTQYALLAGRTGGQTLIGSTATNSGLTLRSTAGVGAAGADIVFQTGNNGATEAMRILNGGNVGIGTNNPSTRLDVVGGVRLGNEPATCVAGLAGTFRYNSSLMQFCDGSAWQTLGVSGSGVASVSSANSDISVANATTTPQLTLNSGTAGGVGDANRIAKLDGSGELAVNMLPTVTVAKGGTGLTSGTSGGIPYFNATSTMASSAALTASGVVVGGGAGGAPTATAAPTVAGQALRWSGSTWAPAFISMFDLRSTITGTATFGSGSVGCTSGQTLTWTAATDNLACTNISLPVGQITGTLPVANGGTGASTLAANQLLLGNGTSAVSALSAGTAGQVLQSNGASAPSWVTPPTPASAGTSGTLLQSNGTSFVNTTATFPGAAGTSGTILRSNGTNWLNSTATYPNTVSANALLYASSADTVAGLSTANSSVLVTNGSGVPSWASIATDTFTQYALLAGRTGGQTLIGSTATNSGLTLRSTAGVGAAGADIVFQTGNNGATEAMRILNGGNVGIGTNNPGTILDIAGQSLLIRGTGTTAGEMRLAPGPTTGTNYVGFRGPASNPAANVLWRLPAADGTNGQVLSTNGSGELSWTTPAGSYTDTNARAAISASAPVAYNSTTGVISLSTVNVASGGTGATTLSANQLLLGNGTSAVSSLSAGSSGQILRSAGTSAPAWSTATYPATTGSAGTFLRSDGTNYVNSTLAIPNAISTNEILFGSGSNAVGAIPAPGATSSVLISTFSTGTPTWLAGSTANRVLRTNGSTVGFAQVDLSTDVTGTLAAGSLPATVAFTSGNAGAVSLGSTNANALSLIANNTTRLQISSAGVITISGQTADTVPAAQSAPFDYQTTNVHQTTSNCTGSTWSLSNMQDGGTFTLAVKPSAAHTGVCQFSHTGLTFRYTPTNATPAGTSHVIYSMMRIGSDVYVSWVDGL